MDRNTGFIWTMGLDGSQLTQITASTPAATCNWSGDGAMIYFWAKPVNRLAGFYQVVLETGAIEPLFNGQTYWSWFNDGGFEVFTWTNRETDETFDFFQFGANQFGGNGKCDILQLRVTLEAADFTALFGGLGDLFTPSRGAVDNRLLIQADHDRAGSHRVYLIQADGTTIAMTDLFSGNPAWNRDQSSFAYIQAPSSTRGSTAYQGSLWVRGIESGSAAVLINSTGRRPGRRSSPRRPKNRPNKKTGPGGGIRPPGPDIRRRRPVAAPWPDRARGDRIGRPPRQDFDYRGRAPCPGGGSVPHGLLDPDQGFHLQILGGGEQLGPLLGRLFGKGLVLEDGRLMSTLSMQARMAASAT